MSQNKPQYIIVHHTAVSYDKNPDQFKATDNYHKSKGWGMIGYHYEIAKDGTLYKGREEDMVGAHCYQNGMNYKSIGIVLDGNFDIEEPTAEQVKTLRKLLLEVSDRYDILPNKIVAHRHYAGYKTCYGSNLSDSWARDLIKDSDIDYMFTLQKTNDSADVYAVKADLGLRAKIANEYTYNGGVKLGMWSGDIEVVHVNEIEKLKLVQEIVMSPSDNN